MITDFAAEFLRYKLMGQKALAQISDEGLNQRLGQNLNSAAVLVRHISGNFISRFTDFLTTDGEKPWRDREAEFAVKNYTRAEMEQHWNNGWQAVENALAALTEADAEKQITIRGQALTVHQALLRALAHAANHVGQLILMARIQTQENWQWITIPKNKSAEYNQNPTMEKSPL